MLVESHNTEDQPEVWYGAAPHYYDPNIKAIMDRNVFTALPGEPNEDGQYWIEDMQAYFMPDETRNNEWGIWTKKSLEEL